VNERTHILVTGSRSYTDRAMVVGVLNLELAWRGPLVLMQGGCRHGPDLFAADWGNALDDNDVIVLERPVTDAEWTTYGSYAGPRRNRRMVEELAVLYTYGVEVRCMAFLGPCTMPHCIRPEAHHSHGATGCADMAEAAGLWTTRHLLGATEKGT
jgi:hypothetical protein